jgi:hypothetical protein
MVFNLAKKILYTASMALLLPHLIKQTTWRGRKIFLARKKTGMPGSEKRDSNKIVQIRHGM